MGKFFDWLTDALFSDTKSNSGKTSSTPERSFSIQARNYDRMRQTEIERLEKAYDFHSIEGVRAIPVPCRQVNPQGSVTGAVEYYLRTQAGRFWDAGQHDLSIECLKKSNQLLPHSFFMWQIKDFARLVEYLKNDGRWEEAEEEERKILEMFGADSLYGTKKEQKDRYEFDWLRRYAPDIAPKSFNGFMRMKNAKSQNYLKIKAEAKKKGYKQI